MLRLSALLLDIDGTLVDNTAQHIAAWEEAFTALDRRVDRETLRRYIGQGGDVYVKSVAGVDWDRRYGDECRRRHGDAYSKQMGEVRPVAGAAEFLDQLKSLELRPVLASSSNPDEVGRNLAVIGKSPRDFLVIDKDDIGTSKPAPDVFEVALGRSGVRPEEAVAVGDTRWDGEAAAKLAIRFYGMVTGGGRVDELRAAQAERVFASLAELRDVLSSTRG